MHGALGAMAVTSSVWREVDRPLRWSDEECPAWLRSWRGPVVPQPWVYSTHHYLDACNASLRRDVAYVRHRSYSLEGAEDEAAVLAAMRRLRGRTLYFYGDSITLEHFLACACWFRATALASRGTVGPAAVTSRAARCVELQLGGADGGRHESIRLCYGSSLSGDQLRSEFAAVGRRNGVVVAGLGLPASTPQLVASVAGEVVSAVRSLGADERPRFIWREFAAQHFPNPTGQYVHRKSWPNRGPSCSRATPNFTSFHNDAASPVVRAAGFPVLPTWRASLERSQDHYGVTSVNWERRPILDCTHLCLHSGVVDHWVAILARWINGEGESLADGSPPERDLHGRSPSARRLPGPRRGGVTDR